MKNLVKNFAPTLLLSLLISGCANNAPSASAPPAIPDSPDGTVVAIAENLATYHPEILWEALPESYRNDINQVTQTFAAKMDPEIYDRSLALVGRAVEVLQQKQDLILASNSAAALPAETTKVEMGMTSGLAVMQMILGSEISTLEGLGTVDWQQFLSTTGSQVLEYADSVEAEEGEDPFAEINSLTVETVEATDETAILRISSANQEPEEVEMVRVEGRWVPQDLAEEWDANVANALATLEELTPERMEELKGQAAFGLAMAEGIIEQVAAVESAEEFDALVGPMIQAVMGNLNFAVPPQADEDEGETE